MHAVRTLTDFVILQLLLLRFVLFSYSAIAWWKGPENWGISCVEQFGMYVLISLGLTYQFEAT